MSQPYVGQILLVGFNFAPEGWAMCNGQLLAISQNAVLFDLIGTTYGGDGVNTFGLPNLQGRAALHMDGSFVIGQQGGAETVTLTEQQLPTHTHALLASANLGTTNVPGTGVVLANALSAPDPIYAAPPTDVALSASAITSTGGSELHDNMQPFLVLNYIISLFGIFPSRN